jgi:hypothetical protein
MKGTILLNYGDNTRTVEEEEKARFLKSILEQCFDGNQDIMSKLQSVYGNELLLLAPQKIELRQILNTYGIQVRDDFDGRLDIFLDNELVASWKKPLYKLKRDLSQMERKKRVYIEMEVDCWSVFDENEAQSQDEEANQPA